MENFRSLNEFSLKGKRCFAVKLNSDCDDFEHLENETVTIDNKSEKVIGVERMLHSPPWRKGEGISVMVEGYKVAAK